MMKLQDFNLRYTLPFIITLFLTQNIFAQFTVKGTVKDQQTSVIISGVVVYNALDMEVLATSDSNGIYTFDTDNFIDNILFVKPNYDTYTLHLKQNEKSVSEYNIALNPISYKLSTLALQRNKKEVFTTKRLKDVEETSIYAGRKNEVVSIKDKTANIATSNARQIYNQVVGLNIYQNDDAGLQLNIGGRGLDPTRTSSFNTRQNGYDISPDVLGYPESYYTPASEGLDYIQIIRGAASLQYGTQFGGLINFVMKTPNPKQPFELVSRNTIGSNGLFTNFTSLSGTIGKWQYYTFHNYKKGDGFRDNSSFNSHNYYGYVRYNFSENTSLSAELTYLNYLTQQAGGLTDQMFYQDAYQSNRSRNWFGVNWLLATVKFRHEFTDASKLNIQLFGLDATRDAVGFRDNRVAQPDSFEQRDLIKGTFKNFGLEAKYLKEYTLLKDKQVFLVGTKFYRAHNTADQGAGSSLSDADFRLYNDQYPSYPNQSSYMYPNLNISLFAENIWYLNKKWSLTPGIRLEHIDTQSKGYYNRIFTDGAGNLLINQQDDQDQRSVRNFILLGLGASFKPSKFVEFYGNFSQNYRSVTFSDISIVNPSFAIDPDISDENGFTTDLGVRGVYKKLVSYDTNLFLIRYNDRIGFVQKEIDALAKSVRGNIGDAVLYGIESLVDVNLAKLFISNRHFRWSVFTNTAITKSKYIRSKQSSIVGNQVELVPLLNFKSGMSFGYKSLMTSLQWSYMSKQFTDATNAENPDILTAVIGQIPAYQVMDFSVSYSFLKDVMQLEAGINNVLDTVYFTRRATGYPGPGIIPSAPRTLYLGCEFKF